MVDRARVWKHFGDAGIHKNQALVLVNYGNATGQEILNVSKIFKTIYKIFGIHIEDRSECNLGTYYLVMILIFGST
jgi:UDP-N-acetylenolpyruvoylglucosamine reductase